MPRLAMLAAGLAALILLAIANAAGYRFGVADQAFYLPSIFHAIDPALYPRDAALLSAQDRLMVSDEVTAWLELGRMAPVPRIGSILGALIHDRPLPAQPSRR